MQTAPNSENTELLQISEVKTKQLLIMIPKIFGIILLFVCFLAFFSAMWYVKIYGNVGFNAILSTLFGNIEGVDYGLVWNFLFSALLPALLLTPLFLFGLLNLKKIKLLKKVYLLSNKAVLYGFAAFCGLSLLGTAALAVDLDQYLVGIAQHSVIYEEEYVDPAQTNIIFPKEKRNLIFIFLESMESTFADRENGGAMDVNLLPNLTQLAKDNIHFSQSDKLGGGRAVTGATWTMGALVAQSSGIPLTNGIYGEAYYENSRFLAGTVTLGDILHENGYQQALMVGSHASFAGRDRYYSDHHTDHIFDYNTAITDGIIPEDYYVWWGMDDHYLFTYAKEKLAELSSSDQPFALSMLTVDTHFPNGYVCDQCSHDYNRQYDNVFACSDRQVANFISWLKEQDFYENTTVIISGDHCTMDNVYIQEVVSDQYSRRMYNCFINVADGVDATYSKNRDFTSLDMFPTTLAAMGCTIHGNRLGLGTNLFSGTQTLSERLGYDWLQRELSSYSNFYMTKLLGMEESAITVCKGKTISYAIKVDEDYLLPMRGIIEKLGGKMSWNGSEAEVKINGKICTIDFKDEKNITVDWVDENKAKQTKRYQSTFESDIYYVDESFFGEVLNLKVIHDTEHNKIVVEK